MEQWQDEMYEKFGLTFTLFFNLAYNVRQAFWDMGKGFKLAEANAGSIAIIALVTSGAGQKLPGLTVARSRTVQASRTIAVSGPYSRVPGFACSRSATSIST